jgi:hypothetical protein
MIVAHVAGVPVEELAAPLIGGGALMAVARVWLAAFLHRHEAR